MKNRSEGLIVLALILSMTIAAAPIVEVNANPEGLIYDNSYSAHSAAEVTTTSAALVDDAQASLTFPLHEAKIVLVIYSACNNHTTIESEYGKKLGINIDASDVATIHSSPYYNPFPPLRGFANGGVVIWVGILAAGSHTVKGRFATNGGNPVQTAISERRLSIIIFTGIVNYFRFVRSTVPTTTTSASLVDDAEALVTFTSPDCKALILYSACNYHSTGEHVNGKKIAVSTDSSDGLAQESSPAYYDYADSEFIAEIRNLTSGIHTIKGRFASNSQGQTVTISERQFAILLFPSSLETDFVESATQASVNGDILLDDNEASITRTTTATRYALAIYCAGKKFDTYSAMGWYGMKVAVTIDATDYELNAQSIRGPIYPETTAIQSDVVELDAGTHTVKGRFAHNAPDGTAKVDARQLCVLWFGEAAHPVGGAILPVDKLALVAPYILTLIAVAAMVTAIATRATTKKRIHRTHDQLP